jgi:hypothetical protein
VNNQSIVNLFITFVLFIFLCMSNDIWFILLSKLEGALIELLGISAVPDFVPFTSGYLDSM